MRINKEEVAERIPIVVARSRGFTTGDLIDTIHVLQSRLYYSDHEAHTRRINEVCRFLRRYYNGRAAVDALLIEFGALCFQAGTYETTGESFTPENEHMAALLEAVKARLVKAPEEE